MEVQGGERAQRRRAHFSALAGPNWMRAIWWPREHLRQANREGTNNTDTERRLLSQQEQQEHYKPNNLAQLEDNSRWPVTKRERNLNLPKIRATLS